MDTVSFLRVIWPSQGLYCVGEVMPKRDGGTWWKHAVFTTIEAAANRLIEISRTKDAYQCVHTLKLSNINGGMKGVRAGPNMAMAQCFYGDLDVGENKEHATRKIAAAALANFCAASGLPLPMTVSSGYGIHVYWLLTEAIPSDVWKRIADKLKLLASPECLSLAWDVSVPGDMSRVLRAAGTLNWKRPELGPQPVDVRGPVPERITPEAFEAIIDAALAKHPAARPTAAAAGVAPGLTYDTGIEPPEGPDVRKVCPSFDYMAGRSKHAPQPEWHLLMGLLAYIRNGDRMAHKLSAVYVPPVGQEGYSAAKTDAKLAQWRALTGPPRCATVHQTLGMGSPCSACPLRPLDSSPVILGRTAPIVQPEGDDVPPPGGRFTRTTGGVVYATPAKDGEPPMQDIILPYDLYPRMIVDEEARQTRAVEWVLTIPPAKGGTPKVVVFRMKAGELNDERALLGALANAGGFADKRHAKRLGEYMSHYIRMLQRHQGEQQQYDHFGFTVDRKAFVLPEAVITAEGDKPARLASALANLSPAIRRVGSREVQIAALGFYNHACYQPQQFIVAASLGSILMGMTGFPGAVVSFGAEQSGVSKTTALYTAGSLWAERQAFVLNGNTTGTSLKMRLERLRLLSSLPLCMDEVTLQAADDLKDFALNSSQSARAGRLQQNGEEKIAPATPRGNLILLTSNVSLQDAMSRNNQSGVATAMRTIDVRATGAVALQHTTLDAQGRTITDISQGIRHLKLLENNYGHVGPEFARHVVANYAAVEAMVEATLAEVIRLTNAQPSERFWMAVVTVVIVAARIAHRLGLLPYDPEALLEWAATVLVNDLRGELGETYEQPIDMLQDYLTAIVPNTLMVGTANQAMGADGVNVLNDPRGHGGLLARKELDGRTMRITVEGFRDYLKRRHAAPLPVIRTLEQAGVVKRDRVSLGKGTQYAAAGQQRGLIVHLDHPDLAGPGAFAPVEKGNVVKLRAS